MKDYDTSELEYINDRLGVYIFTLNQMIDNNPNGPDNEYLVSAIILLRGGASNISDYLRREE